MFSTDLEVFCVRLICVEPQSNDPSIEFPGFL